MKKSDVESALNNLNRSLLLLKSERHKIIRNEIIDSLLNVEIITISEYIRKKK